MIRIAVIGLASLALAQAASASDLKDLLKEAARDYGDSVKEEFKQNMAEKCRGREFRARFPSDDGTLKSYCFIAYDSMCAGNYEKQREACAYIHLGGGDLSGCSACN